VVQQNGNPTWMAFFARGFCGHSQRRTLDGCQKIGWHDTVWWRLSFALPLPHGKYKKTAAFILTVVGCRYRTGQPLPQAGWKYRQLFPVTTEGGHSIGPPEPSTERANVPGMSRWL
jgi:hypothetical protein